MNQSTLRGVKKDDVITKKLADIRENPGDHAAHDPVGLALCCTVGGELNMALSAAHWEHVT